MAQKRIKRTDQEWFDLIKDCKTSSLEVKIWCEQHGITAKAIDYHTRRLRQKGYTIPQKIPQTFPCEKQEIVCLDISKSLFAGQKEITSTDPWAANAAVLQLDFQGTSIGFLIMQRRKPSKIPFLRCAACVRRYFRSIKALPYNRAYRYEAFHQWPHGDNPGYLPDGPLRKHTVSFLRQEDRPAQSPVS